MKKLMIFGLTFIMVLLSSVSVFAGDVPESLLSTDDAKVFLATVENYTIKPSTISAYAMIDTIELMPTEKIKGDVIIGVKESYSRCDTKFNPESGVEYLVGYIDENNLYIYEIESREGNRFKLVDADSFDMTKRLENYLNDGSFERAEQDRLAKFNGTHPSSPTVIGGAENPTNITVKSPLNIRILVGIGAVLLIVAAGIILGKRGK